MTLQDNDVFNPDDVASDHLDLLEAEAIFIINVNEEGYF